MKIYCYSIEENGSLASLPGEDWQRHREETKSPLWVHIEGGSVDQVHEVLAPLALHKLLLGMIDDRDSFGSRIIPWENALLLVVPALGDETLNSSAYSASLVLEDLLITLAQSPAERLSEFTDYLRSRRRPAVGFQAQRLVRLKCTRGAVAPLRIVTRRGMPQ
jgi:hypothetical protein